MKFFKCRKFRPIRKYTLIKISYQEKNLSTAVACKKKTPPSALFSNFGPLTRAPKPWLYVICALLVVSVACNASYRLLLLVISTFRYQLSRGIYRPWFVVTFELQQLNSNDFCHLYSIASRCRLCCCRRFGSSICFRHDAHNIRLEKIQQRNYDCRRVCYGR